MDKALANYLFHNEVLFAFQEEGGALTGEQQETKAFSRPVQAGSNSDKSEPDPVTSEAVNGGVYIMKTRHLVVVKNLVAAEKELLEKIMIAIQLQMSVVDLVDVSHYPNIDFKETIYGNSPRAILFFGPESGEDFLVRLKLEKYTPKELKGINFLMADNLATILKNENGEKKKLWECLRAVFDV